MREMTEIIAEVGQSLAVSGAVRAVFLAGSLARGLGDAWSDLDLVALPKDGADGIAEAWQAALAPHGEVVFHRQSGGGAVLLLNTYLSNGLRFDLYVAPEAEILRRGQDRVKPLFDPEGLYGQMAPVTPALGPNPRRVAYIIEDFLRILFLVPVVVGRQEHLVSAMGAGMLRDHLMALMMEIHAPGADRGLLHLSAVLPPNAMAVLEGLPVPGWRQDPQVQLALAAAFLPRARMLAEALEIPWPSAFEAAVRDRFQTELGLDLP